ncbi:MAG: hypothetical protein HY959_09280 [Ignavibacteriae bacterium]|nr:hypothetical protein [Ignavibacteriota bacterium]
MTEFKIYQNLAGKLKNSSEGMLLLYRTAAIILLFILTIYFVYYAPIGTDKLFGAVLLFVFWYSKSDYFWFAFFIIISAFPGGLFSENTFNALRRLPIYSPVPKISFSLMDLFLIVALIKAFAKGKKTKIKDVFKLKYIAYILPYILVVSIFHGVTLKIFLNGAVRGLFFYTLLFSFPALVYNRKEVYKFMTIFFPFVLLELISQIYTLRFGLEFANIFNPGSISEIMNSVSGDIRAIPTGYINMRLAFVFAFVLLESKENIVPKFYSYFVIFISLSSVLISATRSAIIMLLFIFIFYFILIAKKKPNLFLQVFVSAAVFLMLMDALNLVDFNSIIGSSYKRFVGAVSVEEGTVVAEDTFDNRISNRFPVLWESISRSIFIGYGFSDKYFINYDGHLGGVLIGLLQVGIFGFTMYAIFIVNIFRKCFWYIKRLPADNSVLGIIKVFTLSFAGYLIVNLTVDPIYVLNSSTLPQDIFIHLVIASFFINLAVREQIIKKKAVERISTAKVA